MLGIPNSPSVYDEDHHDAEEQEGVVNGGKGSGR